MPQTNDFQRVYTDYMCKVNTTVHAQTTCGLGPNTTSYMHTLGRLSKAGKYHLLVYGPSWAREIVQTMLVAATVRGDTVKADFLGETDPTKTCYCKLSGEKCPCADYAVYSFKSGGVLTSIINYDKLQKPGKGKDMREIFAGRDAGGVAVTHAIVMEPHAPCFFNSSCPAADGIASPGNQPGPGLPSTWYGCEWSGELWTLFKTSFPTDGSLVHVVPWNVPKLNSVNASEIAVRTRETVEQYACEPDLEINPVTGSFDMSKPGAGSPTVSDKHQCLFVCNEVTRTHCQPGSPWAVASLVLSKLTLS